MYRQIHNYNAAAGPMRAPKETGNHSRKQEAMSDEITLKDEILDLKRQVMTLKRTNEQYSVRLRKYEDEAKRKDIQLEQLMNPRKNADVTKVLSTKGAAILMNLKDQNNALIQMLLNKNLHIRRLVAEVKMSKLYATTKRDECYKAEISRLRNLLMKSEEILRENFEVQREQMRSICIDENPISESSSSDQSSSGDLDELRYTILSLESHIKYSNDLLAQKNQEISLLSDELSFLRRYIRCKGYKSEVFDYDNSRSRQLSTTTFRRSWPNPLNSKKLSSQDVLKVFEKNQSSEYGPLPNSAPASSTILVPSYSSTPEPRLPKSVSGGNSENCATAAVVMRTDLDYSSVSTMGKSLLHTLAAEEILKAEKMLSRARKPLHTKGRWKQALTKYKELKKLNPRLIAGSEENRKPIAASEIPSKFSDLGTRELEIVEKDNDDGGVTVSPVNDEITFRAGRRLKSDEAREETEGLEPIIKHRAFPTGNNDLNDNDMTLESCQTFENSSVSNERGECSKAELFPNNKSENTDKKDENAGLIIIPHAREELKTSFENGSGEIEQKERKSLREAYCQSLDSSFDSENSYSSKQDFQVQVEVQINAVSLRDCTDQLKNSISENSKTNEFCEEGGRDQVPDFEFNDDDDVIIR